MPLHDLITALMPVFCAGDAAEAVSADVLRNRVIDLATRKSHASKNGEPTMHSVLYVSQASLTSLYLCHSPDCAAAKGAEDPLTDASPRLLGNGSSGTLKSCPRSSGRRRQSCDAGRVALPPRLTALNAATKAVANHKAGNGRLSKALETLSKCKVYPCDDYEIYRLTYKSLVTEVYKWRLRVQTVAEFDTEVAAEREAAAAKALAKSLAKKGMTDAERAALKAEKDAEKERLKAEKEAEKENLRAEKEAEKERLKARRKSTKERLKAEKEAEKEAEKSGWAREGASKGGKGGREAGQEDGCKDPHAAKATVHIYKVFQTRRHQSGGACYYGGVQPRGAARSHPRLRCRYR